MTVSYTIEKNYGEMISKANDSKKTNKSELLGPLSAFL